MKRFIYSLIFILCGIETFAYSRMYNPYVNNCTYQILQMKIWNMDGFHIQGGDAINDGIEIEIDFTTPTSSLNGAIFSLGIFDGDQTYTPAIIMYENGNDLSLKRKVSIGNVVKTHEVNSWTKNQLKRGTNYTIDFEIDETRCRYCIYETGKPSSKIYEYEFWGLMDSQVKTILSTQNQSISISTNSQYQVKRLFFKDLAHGQGVETIPPKTDILHCRMKGKQSNLFMKLRDNDLADNIQIVQDELSLIGPYLWEFENLYQKERTPTSFHTKIRNLSSGRNLSFDRCLVANGTNVLSTSSYDCNIWDINNETLMEGVKLRNVANNTYAVVQNASIMPNANIIEYETGYTTNSHWNILPVEFEAPIETGNYLIKNTGSSLFISPSSFSYTAPSVSQGASPSYGDAVWHVEKLENGLYKIVNVDSKKVLAVQDASTAFGANVLQWVAGGHGNELWEIEKSRSTPGSYLIRNIHSNLYMAIQGGSTSIGAGVVQNSFSGADRNWQFVSVDYKPANSLLGGVFKIKHKSSNTYMVIRDASLQAGTEAVAWSSADLPNGYWTLEEIEDGGYAIKNIKSGLYLSMENETYQQGGYARQNYREIYGKRGSTLWKLERTDEPQANEYYIRNLHSGYMLHYRNDYSTNGSPVVQSLDSPLTRYKFEWVLEPVQQ